MNAAQLWWVISGIALSMGILWLLISGFVGYKLIQQVVPLMDETKEQIHDLGELASQTVANTAEALDLIEQRVGQTVEQATEGGTDALQQMVGVGSVLAGVSIAARLARLIPGGGRQGKRSRRGKRRSRLFSRR